MQEKNYLWYVKIVQKLRLLSQQFDVEIEMGLTCLLALPCHGGWDKTIYVSIR